MVKDIHSSTHSYTVHAFLIFSPMFRAEILAFPLSSTVASLQRGIILSHSVLKCRTYHLPLTWFRSTYSSFPILTQGTQTHFHSPPALELLPLYAYAIFGLLNDCTGVRTQSHVVHTLHTPCLGQLTRCHHNSASSSTGEYPRFGVALPSKRLAQ